MPPDAQDSTTSGTRVSEALRSALQALPAENWPRFYHRPDPPDPASTAAVSEGAAPDRERLDLHCVIPDTLACFAGHFTGQPVLPGVLQLHWAIHLSQLVFGLADFREVRNLKYKSVIEPGASVTLSMTKGSFANTVRFSMAHEDTRYSDGLLEFRSC